MTTSLRTKFMMLFRAMIALAAGLVVALAVPAFAAASEHASPAADDLRPIYQKPDLDLGRYDRVLVDSLGLDDARVVAPPWFEGEARNPARWQLTGEDIRFLRESYRAAMYEQLEQIGGYRIVQQPEAGVLVLDIEIISLMPYARRDEDVTVKGFGEMLVQAELRDGANGELLAIYEGWQTVGSEYQQNTRLNAENSLKQLFSIWGERARRVLDAGRG